MKNHSFFLSLALMTLMVGACTDTRENLGLTKKAPDEFAVVKRAPLDLPPNYDLRPPRPGAPRPQEQTTSSQAQQAVFGQSPGAPTGESKGENIFLEEVGAAQADPQIRQKVDEESNQESEEDKTVAEKLFGIDPNAPEGEVIDPVEESQRLKKDQDKGSEPAPPQ